MESQLQYNNNLRNYYKYSPGRQASEWEKFYSENIIAIRYKNLPIEDLSQYSSYEEIKLACGFPENKKSNKSLNLWLFKSAKIGDLVFVNKGVNTCIGIGIITGPYYYEKSENGFNHKRQVKWITNKVYQYKENSKKGYSTLFRPDTFSSTKVWDFILDEYVRIYPELNLIFKKQNLFGNDISNIKRNILKEDLTTNKFPNIKEFIKTSNLQVTGKGTTKEATLFKNNNEFIFNNLKIVISFGSGRALNVPSIAFIGHNQVVKNGIYPVLLYYKDFNLLILAYGVSSSKAPSNNWPNYNELNTIDSYFNENNLGNAPKYGNSYVYKVYRTNSLPEQDKIEKDVFTLTNYFHQNFGTKKINLETKIIKDKKVENKGRKKAEMKKANSTINFWWLNANPNIWKIGSYSQGQLQTYTTHNERGNKRRIYKHFEAIKPGDLVIGYESTPTKQIKAIFEITKGLHLAEEGEVIEFEISEILEYPVNWNELKDNSELTNCEVFINNQGSLFSLSEEEYDIIREIIDEKNITAQKAIEENEIKEYNFLDDADKPFISEEDFNKIISLLKRKKNIILQGSPGVGKTFIAKKIAYQMMKKKNDLPIEIVQFHQSYSYEDFIQGLRPSENGSFELKDGIFYSFCQQAADHPDESYFFIIDEINRGNLSKIFGELMMLIETDKRGQRIKLTYSKERDERFSVPDNLYIIGTMNTADRSLAIVDYALRRRFAFVTLKPDYNESFRDFLIEKGMTSELVNHIIKQIKKINEEIKNDPNLGDGFQIGHSYFCNFSDDEDEKEWWREVVDYELKPLLEEIWFDDLNKAKRVLNDLIF